jgi:hypothetical protein
MKRLWISFLVGLFSLLAFAQDVIPLSSGFVPGDNYQINFNGGLFANGVYYFDSTDPSGDSSWSGGDNGCTIILRGDGSIYAYGWVGAASYTSFADFAANSCVSLPPSGGGASGLISTNSDCAVVCGTVGSVCSDICAGVAGAVLIISVCALLIWVIIKLFGLSRRAADPSTDIFADKADLDGFYGDDGHWHSNH